MGLEIAAVAALASATAATVGTAGSFIQAGRQKTLAEDAQKSAEKAFIAAEKQLDVNYFEQLGISKTPYENQREQLAQRAAQFFEATGASERGGAATAGRVLAQSNLAEAQIRDQQIKDLQGLQQKAALEESRLATGKANLQLGVSTGSGMAAAQAQQLQQQALTQGAEGLQSTLQAGLSEELLPLYGRKKVNTEEDVDLFTNDLIYNNNSYLGGTGMSSVTGANNYNNLFTVTGDE